MGVDVFPRRTVGQLLLELLAALGESAPQRFASTQKNHLFFAPLRDLYALAVKITHETTKHTKEHEIRNPN
jgi:hypothetical protein